MNDQDQGPVWPSKHFRAMGCQIGLWLAVEDAAEAAHAFAQVEALFETNEQTLSRFRADSELTLVNGRSGQWTPVSSLFWDVLVTTLSWSKITDGLVDPTLLNALEAAGYSSSFEVIAAKGPVSKGTSQPGRWAEIELDDAKQAVHLPAGVRLDFGGIAKGYTARQAVEWLQVLGPCLVDAGGDIAAGSAPPGFPGWPVAVAAPQTSSSTARDGVADDLLKLWLADGSLATSGIDYRHWQQNGRLYHHIINPFTGYSAVTDVLTATVMASDAVQAEAWTKVALILGMEEGLWRLEQEEIAGILVGEDGRIVLTTKMASRVSRQQMAILL